MILKWGILTLMALTTLYGALIAWYTLSPEVDVGVPAPETAILKKQQY